MKIKEFLKSGRWKVLTFIVVGILVFTISTNAVVGQLNQAIVHVNPVTQAVDVNDTVTVTIDVANVTDLYAFQLEVGFDPDVLRLDSIEEGDFLRSGGTTVGFDGSINNTAGTITGFFYTLIRPVPGVTGSGALATLIFTGLTNGTSDIELNNVKLVDSNIIEIPSSTTDGTVTVITPPEVYVVSLSAGWNLISTPLQPVNTGIESILDNLTERIVVTSYDTPADEWYTYDSNSSESATLNEITTGKGYWLHSEFNQNLTITGHESEADIDLYAGWNLVGYNSVTSKSVITSISSLNGSIIVSTYNPLDYSWNIFSSADFPFLNTIHEFIPGRGYWLRSDYNQTWQNDE